MTWPVGKLEQLIKIKELQRQLEEVQSSRRGIVIHSYNQPSRAAWELAYQQQRSGTLPIPPGTKLCWYDMKQGWVKAFTTAWDRENGTATSGEIYPYSQNQNSDYFRFIGNLDVAGYIRGAENNTPNLHFGLDIGDRIRQRILAIDIFFRVNMPVGAVTNYLYINYGNVVTQVDVSGVLNRQIEGNPTGPAANNSSSQVQPYRLTSFVARPTNVSYADETAVGKIKILNPFGARLEDGRTDAVAQTSVLGWIFSPTSAYVRSSGPGPIRTNVAYRQFSAVKLTNLNMDQYYRIFSTTNNSGADDNTARKGRGWVYGYFDESMGSLEEYE